MLLILLLFIVPVLVYGLRAIMRESRQFTRTIKISRLVFLALASLYIALLALEKFNYYLIGYRSTSIVYLSAAIAAIVYTLIDRRFILNSFKRIILNIIAIILMMGSIFLVTELVKDYSSQLIYSDSRFRLEFAAKGPMGPCGLPTLFVKSGVYERKSEIMEHDTCISKADIASVSIRDTDSGYLVSYSLVSNGVGNDSGRLVVKYRKP